MSDDPASWAVAGDQVIITITGVDIAKIRYVDQLEYGLWKVRGGKPFLLYDPILQPVTHI